MAYCLEILMGKTKLPDDFAITPDLRSWAVEKAPNVDIDREHENFCDYWRAHGKMMADWKATWRMWMRKAPVMHGALKPAKNAQSRLRDAYEANHGRR